METTGKLRDVSRDWQTGKLLLQFEINSVSDEAINNIAAADLLDIKAVKHRERRSLDANAYFHVLVGKIADVLEISKARCKTELITSYGQIEFLPDGQPAVIKTNIPEEQMLEQEYLHCKPCGVKIEACGVVIFDRLYRGSHTYDSREMSILIDGTVQEAKELGIETLTPAELERMKAAWRSTDLTASIRSDAV